MPGGEEEVADGFVIIQIPEHGRMVPRVVRRSEAGAMMEHAKEREAAWIESQGGKITQATRAEEAFGRAMAPDLTEADRRAAAAEVDQYERQREAALDTEAREPTGVEAARRAIRVAGEKSADTTGIPSWMRGGSDESTTEAAASAIRAASGDDGLIGGAVGWVRDRLVERMREMDVPEEAIQNNPMILDPMRFAGNETLRRLGFDNNEVARMRSLMDKGVAPTSDTERALEDVKDGELVGAVEGAEPPADGALVGTGTGGVGGGGGGGRGAGGGAGATGGVAIGGAAGSPLRDVADKAAQVGLIAGEEASLGAERTADARRSAADAADQIGEDFDRRRMELEDAVDRARQDMARAYRNLEARQIDPDRWWTRKSTGSKIMSGIALGLSALAGAYRGDGVVRALDRIEEEINRDLDIQEKDLGRAERADKTKLRGHERILSVFMQQLGNLPAARNAATRATLQAHAQRIKAEAERIDDAERQAQLMELALQLEARAASFEQNAALQMAMMRARRRRGARGGRGAHSMPNMPDEGRTQWIANKMKNAAGARSAVSQVRRALEAGGDAGLGLDWMAADAVGLGTIMENLVATPEGRRTRQAIENLVAQYTRAMSGAQVSEKEAQRLANIIKGARSPEALMNGLDLVTESLDEFETFIASGDPVAYQAWQENRQRFGPAARGAQPQGGGGPGTFRRAGE